MKKTLKFYTSVFTSLVLLLSLKAPALADTYISATPGTMTLAEAQAGNTLTIDVATSCAGEGIRQELMIYTPSGVLGTYDPCDGYGFSDSYLNVLSGYEPEVGEVKVLLWDMGGPDEDWTCSFGASYSDCLNDPTVTDLGTIFTITEE